MESNVLPVVQEDYTYGLKLLVGIFKDSFAQPYYF